jgi:hypothetical protein
MPILIRIRITRTITGILIGDLRQVSASDSDLDTIFMMGTFTVFTMDMDSHTEADLGMWDQDFTAVVDSHMAVADFMVAVDSRTAVAAGIDNGFAHNSA